MPGGVIDLSMIDELLELSAENPQLLRELIDEFLNRTPARIREIKNALTRGQPSLIASEAHSLKSSAGALGAKQMAEICAKLEVLGTHGSLQGAELLVFSLDKSFKLVQLELLKIRDWKKAA